MRCNRAIVASLLLAVAACASPAPPTANTAVTCSAYGDQVSCEDNGCGWGSVCSGTAASCGSLDPVLCLQQAGCGADSSTGACVGAAAACSEFDGGACYSQYGCASVAGCGGF